MLAEGMYWVMSVQGYLPQGEAAEHCLLNCLQLASIQFPGSQRALHLLLHKRLPSRATAADQQGSCD